MADIMKDLEAEPNQIQKGLGECQKHVAQVQSQLDQAVQGFGMAMQTGMQGCQQQAQNAMESGRPESGELPFSNEFLMIFSKIVKIKFSRSSSLHGLCKECCRNTINAYPCS